MQWRPLWMRCGYVALPVPGEDEDPPSATTPEDSAPVSFYGCTWITVREAPSEGSHRIILCLASY
jgi:hypothetical protein